MGQCGLRGWVMRGGGLYVYFSEERLPVCIQKDLTDDALTISAVSLLQNGTARMLKACWRRRVQHLCWWNLKAWPRSPLRDGWMDEGGLQGEFQQTMGDLEHGY